MSEAVFPLLGAACVVFVVLPVSALAVKGILSLLERQNPGSVLHRLDVRYLLLTGSSILPLTWFLSAGVHQAEPGRLMAACLLDHDVAGVCSEPGFFVFTLAVVTLALAARTVLSARDGEVESSAASSETLARVHALVLTHTGLASLSARIDVTDCPGFALGTAGLFRPRVIVGAGYAAGLSDDALASALAHELEHVRSYDPLRYFVLRLSLAVNPLGRVLLDVHAARWLGAQEAHCDRQAVIGGAQPLALAQAILQAVRPQRQSIVALGGNNTSMLRLRVGLLLAFAEQRPVPCCKRSLSASWAALALVVIAMVLPHGAGTEALDVLHLGAEHAVGRLVR